MSNSLGAWRRRRSSRREATYRDQAARERRLGWQETLDFGKLNPGVSIRFFAGATKLLNRPLPHKWIPQLVGDQVKNSDVVQVTNKRPQGKESRGALVLFSVTFSWYNYFYTTILEALEQGTPESSISLCKRLCPATLARCEHPSPA